MFDLQSSILFVQRDMWLLLHPPETEECCWGSGDFQMIPIIPSTIHSSDPKKDFLDMSWSSTIQINNWSTSICSYLKNLKKWFKVKKFTVLWTCASKPLIASIDCNVSKLPWMACLKRHDFELFFFTVLSVLSVDWRAVCFFGEAGENLYSCWARESWCKNVFVLESVMIR